MKWLGAICDISFNLLFMILAFATIDPVGWTSFALDEDAPVVEVLVRETGAWIVDKESGSRTPLDQGTLRDSYAVLRVENYPGVLEDLASVRGELARQGIAAYREELVK